MAKLTSVEDLGPTPQLHTLTDTPRDRTAQFMDQNPGAGLEGLGRGLQVAGNELWDLKEKTDTTKVEDAWNQYRQHAQDLTVGDKGLLTTQGGDAVNGDLLNRSHQALTAARAHLMESLSPDQQRRFAQRADVTDLDTTHSILTHLTTQQFAYAKTVFEGNDAAARSQVVASPTDPGVFTSAKQTLLAQADAYIKQNGADKNTGDALKAKLVDGLWNSRIEALLPTNPVLAESLLRANLTEISNPQLRDTLTARATEASLGVNAGNDANTIIETTRAKLMAPQTQPAAAARAVQVGGNGAGKADGTITPEEQRRLGDLTPQRAQDAVRIIQGELDNADPADRAALQRDLDKAKGDLQRVSGGKATNVSLNDNATPAPLNTSGNVNHRDLAAQLPIMQMEVEKMATAKFGPDIYDPRRQAYARRLTAELHAKVSADVTAVAAIERENQGILLDAVTGVPSPGTGSGLMNASTAGGPAGAPGAAAQPPQKITSYSQIAGDPRLLRAYQGLDSAAKVAVDNMIARNLKEDDKGDYVLYRTLWNKINAGLIHNYEPFTTPDVANQLSIAQIKELRTEVDKWAPPGGKPFADLQKFGDAKAEQYFKTAVMFTAQPDRQIAATMRWNQVVSDKLEEYAKAGKDPRTLFREDTPDSVINTKYLETFINSTPAQGLAEGAAAIKQGGNPVNIARAPATIKNAADADAWIKTLPPNVTSFVDLAGQVRLIPGRQGGAAPAQPQAAAPANAPANVSDLLVNPATQDRSTWGKREDGTDKGLGFLGLLRTPNGQVASEFTIGVPIGGKQTEIPTLVPTLTRPEVEEVLAGKVSDTVKRKAIDFAEGRISAGKPVFASDAESPSYQGPTMNPDTGKLVDPAPIPPTPAQTGPRTAANFQIVDRPDTVAGNVQAIRQARETAMAVRNQDIEWDVRQHPLEAIRSLLRGVEAMGGGVRNIGSYLQGKIPTQLESVYNGFEAIKESGKVSHADEDVLRQVLKYGLLNPDDTQLANGLLQRITSTPKKKK